MKSKYFFIGLIMLAMSFTSCRKIYTCSCVVNEVTTVTQFNNEHKQNVENQCSQMQDIAKLEDSKATCTVEEAINQQQ